LRASGRSNFAYKKGHLFKKTRSPASGTPQYELVGAGARNKEEEEELVGCYLGRM
jgi:hypothetical protein